MKKLIVVFLAAVLVLSMAPAVSAAGSPQFSYELVLTDGNGMPVSDPRALSAGDILNVEIVLTRTDVSSSYDMFGIEFRLMTQGLSYNHDGKTLRKGTLVREMKYSDGDSVGFAWYDMQQKGEKVNNPVLAGSWSYIVTRPSTVKIEVPVSLVYVTGYKSDNVPTRMVNLALDTKGGSFRGEDPSGLYKQGTTITLPKPVREGYAFTGWYDGYLVHYPNEELTLNTSMNLEAMWVLDNPNWEPGYTVDLLITDSHINYLKGYPDGTIKPQNNITRAEVATIFYRLMTEKARSTYESVSNDYSDVQPNMWHNKAVSTLSNAGILTGYPDGNFYPNRAITRAELAAIIDRFTSAEGGVASFFDVENHWAADNIGTAELHGWITGYPDGSFRPNRSISRAEAVAIVNRLLGRYVDDINNLLPGMETFSDNMNTSAWYYFDIQEATNNHSYQRLYGSKYEKWIALLENIQY